MHEIPALGAVQDIRLAAEPGLVLADNLVQAVVHRHHIRRMAVVEIEDRDQRAGIVDLLAAVGDVQRDQVPVREILFRLRDHVRDPVLPPDWVTPPKYGSLQTS